MPGPPLNFTFLITFAPRPLPAPPGPLNPRRFREVFRTYARVVLERARAIIYRAGRAGKLRVWEIGKKWVPAYQIYTRPRSYATPPGSCFCSMHWTHMEAIWLEKRAQVIPFRVPSMEAYPAR